MSTAANIALDTGADQAESLSRRGFLGSAAAATGSLVVGFHVPLTAQAQSASAPPEVNAWLVV